MSERDYKEYKESFDSIKEHKEPTEYLKELINLICKVLLERDRFVKNSDNDEARVEFFKLLLEKIKETYQEYQNRNPEAHDITQDIEFIGAGHTSLAFRIGDVVLKVGKEKDNWTSRLMEKYQNLPGVVPVFYNHSHMVAEHEYYSIQITPLVDTSHIEEEEVYGAYKKLRTAGYIWNDPLPENMGKIMTDFDFNGRHYQKGDIVVIDLEDMAYVGETISDDVLDEISMMSLFQLKLILFFF